MQRFAAVGGVGEEIVELALHPCCALDLSRVNALFAVAGAAQNMRGQRAVWIKAHLARTEQQARLTDVVHRLSLFRADLAPDPDKPSLACKIAGQTVLIEVREDRRQLLRRPFGFDHLMGMGVEREGIEIGRQHPPVTVEDVAALCHDRGSGDGSARLRRFGLGDDPHL